MAQAQTPTGSLTTALEQCAWLLERAPERALAQADEILRAVPGEPRALALRGRALAAMGRAAEAIVSLRDAVTRDPGSSDAWRALGDALVLTHAYDAADQAYARHLRASVNDPRLRAAANALCDNDLARAERLLKPHLKAHPTDIAAIRMLAELAGRLRRYRDAEALLERALELAPGFAEARFNLATVYFRQNKAALAIGALDRLLADNPGNVAGRNLKGAALARIGDYADAAAQFEAVLRDNPGQPRVWMSYGHTLKTLGRQAESIAAYRRALALKPGLGEAWWSLANLKTLAFSDDDRAGMEAVAGRSDLAKEDRFHLLFALGKAYEDAGHPDRAFTYYAEANRLRRSVLPYDPEETTRAVDRATATFTPTLIAGLAGAGCPAADPIFIVGLPRSGSTLIEQILASHPLVEGTQELSDVITMARRLGSEAPGYPEMLAALTPTRLAELGAEYLERTRVQRKTDRPFFVDKMPNNWLHIGLIHLMLPNARIVDARRHPLGCCLSNYKQHFARGQAFSYGLADLGRYYRDYLRLMEHFDVVLPGRVHHILYETMVDDTEPTVRRLLDALALPFDAACLRFYTTTRGVRTASSEQVRQPIFRSGAEGWHTFEPFLGELRDSLGDAIDRHARLP